MSLDTDFRRYGVTYLGYFHNDDEINTMVEFFQGFLVGAAQGITEWLPVSSSAINTLVLMNFFQKTPGEALRLSIWLHTGTLLAALIYFRGEVVGILRSLPQYVRELRTNRESERNSLITFLIVSTLVAGAVAAPLVLLSLAQQTIPTYVVMPIIGVLLIITGLLQKFAFRASGTKTVAGIKDAILLGAAQGFAALPGLSRSGVTVSAFLFRGYDAKYAIKLSFLMSIPYVFAAEVGLNLIRRANYDLMMLGGILGAFIFGILTIGALLKIAARVRFWKFCLVLGVLSFLPLLMERF
ncbi:MAG: undecaprenyl-diphosphate phosphatase [Chloroflexi bacterium]|nr:undecaprenyl-diphosphate phosphatase [Chloroflexota bacterium]